MSNSGLTTLPNFSMLTEIKGGLSILNNAQLTTLPTFPSLTSLGALTIQGNTALSDCCALLPFLETELPFTRTDPSNTIRNNAEGCSSELEARKSCALRKESLRISNDGEVPADVMYIPRIMGDLTITGSLSSFPNFASLEVVEGSITIEALSHASLTDLANIFPVLNNITGNLVLRDNNLLKTITGFMLLDNIGGNLEVDGHDLLTTLPMFSALRTIQLDLTITSNNMLTGCCGLFPFLADGTAARGGNLSIHSNAVGCGNQTTTGAANVADIRDVCDPLRALSISTPSPITISSAKGVSSFSVKGNVPWSLVNASIPAWITPNATSGTGDADIQLDYDANSSLTIREATLMMQSTDAGASMVLTASIKVIQAGAMRSLSISTPSPLPLTSAQGMISFSVKSNVPWSLVNASVPAWITPNATSGTGDADIQLDYDANNSLTLRMATLMLQSTDAGASTVLTASIRVDQAGAARSLSISTSSPRPPPNAYFCGRDDFLQREEQCALVVGKCLCPRLDYAECDIRNGRCGYSVGL